MSTDMTGSDRNWPKTGLWGTSFRVMFPLAALWAALCVALWQWGQGLWPNLDLSLAWHIHEMTLGFGGAAVGGYLLTACSSWTGRAPVSGLPLLTLAVLWLATRAGLLLQDAVPLWAPAALSLAYFWSIAALLGLEAKRAGKGWRPVFMIFCLFAGIGSALWIRDLPSPHIVPASAPVLGFALLLSVVSLRMVPAFLQNAATRQGQSYRVISSWEYVVLIGALLAAGAMQLAGHSLGAAILYAAAGIGLFSHFARWPLRPALHDSLLAMLALGFVWLATGVLMLAGHLGLTTFTYPQATHALMMGAMGGLIMAVSARAFATRRPNGLRARPGTALAFLSLMASVPLRLIGNLDLAATLWCAAWLLYFVLMLPGLRGLVPRPVFSGNRTP